ncbi:hypothetical protein BLA24_28080 [Streptomyces cinnamoneus]|uniref:Uncharacterized protein n=1 Tax=Streptomyces cinnamoneus TaxID=53446 RepID=A0A2G1XCH5_STRCJ|nr:hypothetical protein BLA24_28080 [Streptomyces cinnamoneus]
MYVQVIHEDWVDRQQAACRIMARPQMEFVVAWGGPALGVAAVILCVLLARRTRRRHGVRLGETWPGLIAYLSVGAMRWPFCWSCSCCTPRSRLTGRARFWATADSSPAGTGDATMRERSGPRRTFLTDNGGRSTEVASAP